MSTMPGFKLSLSSATEAIMIASKFFALANRVSIFQTNSWKLRYGRNADNCAFLRTDPVKFGLYVMDNYSEVQNYIDLTNAEKYILIDELSKKYDVITEHIF